VIYEELIKNPPLVSGSIAFGVITPQNDAVLYLLSRLSMDKLVTNGVHLDILSVINIQELFVDIRALSSGHDEVGIIFT